MRINELSLRAPLQTILQTFHHPITNLTMLLWLDTSQPAASNLNLDQQPNAAGAKPCTYELTIDTTVSHDHHRPQISIGLDATTVTIRIYIQ